MHHLTFKIVHSTTKVLPAWNAILVEKKLPQRLIPRDVRTRWNSTYDMLQVALKYCTAVDTLCSRREHSLRVFELSPEEWTIMQELCDMLEVRRFPGCHHVHTLTPTRFASIPTNCPVPYCGAPSSTLPLSPSLSFVSSSSSCAFRHAVHCYWRGTLPGCLLCSSPQVFKDATLYFSCDTPNLAMVILVMDHIDNLLTTQTRAFSPLFLPISGALRLANKTLNQYYKLFDMSATYRIAMSKLDRTAFCAHPF